MDRRIASFVVLIALISAASVHGQHGCQEVRDLTFTAATDTASISSDNFDEAGNYLPYTWCRWVVTVPSNRRIRINVNGIFDVEEGEHGQCNMDFVNVYEFPPFSPAVNATTLLSSHNVAKVCRDIETLTHPVIGPVCGTYSNFSFSYTSRTNRIIVDFCTDYGTQGRGWKAELEFFDWAPPSPSTQCNHTVDLTQLTDTFEIRSPSFPANYPPNQHCTWTVRTNPNYPVLVDARLFDLDRWCYDSLTITDISNNVVQRFCSDNELMKLRFENTSQLVFTFVADDVQEGAGFDIALSLVACRAGYQACDNPALGCVSVEQQCDGIVHCADGSDEKHEYCYPDCGVAHFPMHSESARIIGGIEANPYSVPWQVAMLRAAGNSQFCGGTIISNRWILTAGHCFTGGPSSAPQFRGRVGGHDVLLSANDDLGTDMEFETVLCHPYYGTNPRTTDFDYCMIKTKQPIKFRKNVVPACLPRQGQEVAPDTMCIASGWGRNTGGWVPNPETFANLAPQTRNGGKPLRHVTVPVVNRTVCGEMHGPNKINDRMICSGFLGIGGKNTCHGDSGGPFVCKNQYNKYMVAGIVSWGPPTCAHIDFPAVYANTAYAMNWIYEIMANN
ncbi:suppressor of tumorigenicity 14 protein-like [Paramacrobiotus metropolitanus]|uniref:suppressor of tumorigenicity 14 protein-like n=1 Tax=Paramacrobiotus metropolitanus TaxID=2943436 RepID=UPI0024460DDB|nr:suppressor of tumorigenicity 14 protein-like [Paramacrobiotus metropolitanus]XP_055350658.1 suppressor of tumorigenicity 14 protein-like [Paramacrobiotus metropolitanus]